MISLGFIGLLIVGIIGLVNMKTNWRLEWFMPEDSYVNEFYDLNEKYFQQGEGFNVYQHGIDVYAKQAELNEMSSYLTDQDFIVPGSAKDWWSAFSGGQA